jgi:hypothetical protein
MKSKICLGLLLSLMWTGAAFSQGAADRVSTQIDTSRAQTESRYSKVGNQPQIEKKFIPPEYETVTVPDKRGARQGESLVAGQGRPKTKRVLVPGTGTYTTVTRPAPVRVNPY